MTRKMRHLLTALFALALVGASSATAQEGERERLREAERRVEQVQRALEDALGMLQREESAKARQRLEQSMRDLQSAMTRLDRGRFLRVLPEARVLSGALSLITTGGPKMGVYVRTERHPATDSIGAELTNIVRDGPADEAGLEAGDIVTRANGQELARVGRRGESPGSKLVRIKNELEEGDTLHVEYRRGSDTRTADIVVRHLDDPYTVVRSFPDISVNVPRLTIQGVGPLIARFSPLGWLDVELITLDEDLGQYFGTSDGLLVVRAPDEESLDLKSGDVILNIDGREPTSHSHLARMLRSYEPGETMRIEIMRMKQRRTVTVTVPEREDTFFRREWR